MKKLLFLAILVLTFTLTSCKQTTPIKEVDIVINSEKFTAEVVKPEAEYQAFISHDTNEEFATLRITALTGFYFDLDTTVNCYDEAKHEKVNITVTNTIIAPDTIIYIFTIKK